MVKNGDKRREGRKQEKYTNAISVDHSIDSLILCKANIRNKYSTSWILCYENLFRITLQKGKMAAQASAPPTQVQQKVKAEIKFTAELDEILKRITEIKNIAGVIVVNSEGITVKSTLENSLSVQVRGYPYIHMYRMRANKGRSFYFTNKPVLLGQNFE